MTVSGYTLTGGDAGNYTVAQPAGLTAGIAPAALAVSGVRALDKTYDATTAAALAGTPAVAPLGSDAVSVAGTGSGRFADKNVGVGKAVAVSGYGLVGGDAGNYAVAQPAGLTAAIAPAPLTIAGSVRALDKTYDATTAAGLVGTPAVAPVAGDTVVVEVGRASWRK